MDRDRFEKIVEQAFEKLPDKFKKAIDNLGVVVEDYPADDIVRQMKLPSRYHLLGLYQGIPHKHRDTWYGTSPVLPDKISLYQKSIESVCRTDDELEHKIVEVLIHEIAHYFGMNDEEIRAAGF